MCICVSSSGLSPDKTGKREEEEEKRERLILHVLHAPGGRQLTFTAGMLGWVTKGLHETATAL